MQFNLSRISLAALALVALTLTTTAHAQYQYTEKPLYNFTSKTNGYQPNNLMVEDASGNLYGTTLYGGTGGCGGKGCGSVFELSPSGSGWTQTELLGFDGLNGFAPEGNVIMDASRNLYGATIFGGAIGGGEVFELSPSSTGWTETILYSFTDYADGGYPVGITFDGKGNIYGTARGGGADGFGGVFELSPNGSGGWNETVLYSFTNGNDGANPTGGVVIDAKGNLYGAAGAGGSTTCNNGCGTIFRLTPSGSGWLFSRLYGFQGPGGSNPSGNLIMDASGNLYGSTNSGGHGYGVIFKLAPTPTGGWKETLLHDFTNGADGANPSQLVADSAGNFYGGTQAYAQPSTVFRLHPATTGWIFSILYTFPGTAYASGPSVVDASGNLFGSTIDGTHGYGSIYEISPPAK